MLLTIDVGNTNIVIGLFDDRELKQSWRMETSQRKSADEYGAIMRQLFRVEGYDSEIVTDAIIASVVPSINYTLQHLCEKYFGCTPMFVSADMYTGLKIEYDNPNALGADRIVNAAAAAVLYKGASIIIDFGTATTYCALTSDRRYLGGVIAPGIKIASDALFDKTSRLPKIEIVTPEHVIGKNTVEGMQSGVLLGNVGATEYLVKRMKEELGEPATVIATGGLSSIVSENTNCIDVIDKLLTIKGLQILWELNS